MAEMQDVSGSMRVTDWARLQSYVAWAYQGVPVRRHYEQPVEVLSTAWLLRRGSVVVRERGGRTVEGRAGEWVFPTPDRLGHDFSEEAQIVSVVFKAHWPDNTPLYGQKGTLLCAARQFPELAKAAGRLVRLTRRLRPADSTGLLHSKAELTDHIELSRATLRWIGVYGQAMASGGAERRSLGGGDSRMVWVRQWIERAPLNEPFSESAAARSVGLSASQLSRIFAGAEGVTPRGYWERRRLALASHVLLDSRRSVKEVAYLLGFRQPSHFSNWFKRKTGDYPRLFRRAKRAPDFRQRQGARRCAAD